MAVKRTKGNTANNENMFVDNGATAPKQESNNRPKSIGFGVGLPLIGATKGSEYTNTLAKVINEFYAKQSIQPKVNVFDKEQISNLSYSCIVVSHPNKLGEVCYHITLLEATGYEPLKASDIVQEAQKQLRDPNSRPFIYTPDDAINARLHQIVMEELSLQYKTNKFISTEGLVLHDVPIDLNDLGLRVAAIAYNSVVTESVLSSGEYADLNIAEAIKETNANFKLETNVHHTTQPNLAGSPVRQDYKIDLIEVHNNSGDREFNATDRRRLVSVAGYLDAVISESIAAQQPGMPPVKINRLHPNIIMANNDTLSPTQGFMMLGVAANTITANPNIWLQILAAVDPKSPNSPGGLNIITNIENNQNGVGVPLDFSSKSVTPQEHTAALQQMFSLAPIISYDIESYGPQSYYSSVLAAAAAPNNSSAKLDALDEIIETCVQLTNGHFPNDFNRNEIFVTSGVVIPLGYWMSKEGERDIREIDAAFIANQTGDVNMVQKWNVTALPREITGLDPFLTRVEIINQLIPDAVINGKAVRVTFTNKFINTLTSAIEAAGLVARYESSIVINEQYNTAQFADYLAAASLTNAPGFARQAGNVGGGWQTGYTTMGAFRF